MFVYGKEGVKSPYTIKFLTKMQLANYLQEVKLKNSLFFLFFADHADN
jgi:hypothetical protein